MTREGSHSQSYSVGQASYGREDDRDGHERDTNDTQYKQSEAVTQLQFWTTEHKPIADIATSLGDYLTPEQHGVEDMFVCLGIAAVYSTLTAILRSLEELDGLRWLLDGNRSESKMIFWASSLSGENYHRSRIASEADCYEVLCQSVMEIALRVLDVASGQLLRELTMALKAADAAAFECDQFKVSRIDLFVKENFHSLIHELNSSGHSIDYRFWCSSGTNAGRLVFWDESGFTSLVDMWLLAESNKQCKFLFQRCFSKLQLL